MWMPALSAARSRVSPSAASTTRSSMSILGMGEVSLQLPAEFLTDRQNGQGGSIPERAERLALDIGGQADDRVDVVLFALSPGQAFDNLVDPGRPAPAGRALAARFVGIELDHSLEDVQDRRLPVDDDDGPRAEHRTGSPQRIEIHRQVDLARWEGGGGHPPGGG